MSKIEVMIEQDGPGVDGSKGEVSVGKSTAGRAMLKALAVVFSVLLFLTLLAAVGGFLYLRSFSGTPQYALAEIVDAARDRDNKRIEERLDVDAVVDDFVPQITSQAVELYGRGLPSDVLKKAEIAAARVIPVIKQRARAELPELLRKKTRKFERVPFWILVIGADRYLDIETKDGTAIVRGRQNDRDLELHMREENGLWKVVAVRDEELARKVAEKIGQELIFLAKEAGKNGVEEVGRRLGLDGIGDLLKQAEDIFK
jgi:hypothetical protein